MQPEVMVSDADDLFIAGFMADYFAECEDHLTSIRQALLRLDASVGQPRPDSQVVEELFRAYHSLKGLSGMVEDRHGESLAHEMESYLRALRQRDTVVSQAGVDALIAGVSALDAVLSARREKRPSPAVGTVMRQISAVVPEVIAPEGAASSSLPPVTPARWLVTFVPSAELNARGVNVDNVRARLRERGTIAHATPKVLASGIAFEFGFAGELDAATRDAWLADGVTAEPATAPVAPAGLDPSDDDPAGSISVAEETSRPSSVSHYVRVDLSKLDELMRMIGDLVISRARLEDTLTRIEPRVPAVEWRAVHEDSAVLERQLRDLREGVVRVRLVPVGEIFRRMPFVVRDLAKESGARVRLVLQGQEMEID